MTPSPLLLTRLALRNSRYNSSIRTLHGASTTPFNLNLLGAMTKTAKPTHIIGNSALETQTRSAEVAVEWRKEAEWKEGGVQPAHHANDSASRFQNPWPSFRCVLPLPLTRCTAIDVELWDVRPLPASRWLRVSTCVFLLMLCVWKELNRSLCYSVLRDVSLLLATDTKRLVGANILPGARLGRGKHAGQREGDVVGVSSTICVQSGPGRSTKRIGTHASCSRCRRLRAPREARGYCSTPCCPTGVLPSAGWGPGGYSVSCRFFHEYNKRN